VAQKPPSWRDAQLIGRKAIYIQTRPQFRQTKNFGREKPFARAVEKKTKSARRRSDRAQKSPSFGRPPEREDFRPFGAERGRESTRTLPCA
jgi:hypothetical protein